MIKEPLVSVIIPVYRRKELIVSALENVCASSYRNLEILVLDDGSSDGTLEAAQEAARKDPRIQVAALDHKGVSATRNAGLDKAKGRYVFFMDSDDLIHPRLLETEVELLETGKADAVMSMVTRFRGQPPHWVLDKEPGIKFMEKEEARRSCLTEPIYFKMAGSLMISLENLSDVRFDTDLEYGEDTLFCYRIIMRGFLWAYITSRWYAYRIHRESITGYHTEQGTRSRMKAVDRMLSLERCEGPTPATSSLLNWSAFLLTESILNDTGNPHRLEDIRSWIKDKKEKGLYKEISLINRIRLRLIQSGPLGQRALQVAKQSWHTLRG